MVLLLIYALEVKITLSECHKNRFEYLYEISRKLGCKNIVLHHGYVPGTSYPQNWVKEVKLIAIQKPMF